MDPEQIQFHVERKYLQCVLNLTNAGEMTNELAQLTAQVMQAMRPWNTWADALTKAEFFISKFPIFAPLYEFVKTYKQEEDTKRTIDAMHEQLRENNIEGALQIAQNNGD